MYWQIYHVLSKLRMQTQLEEVPGCGQDLKREMRVDLDLDGLCALWGSR